MADGAGLLKLHQFDTVPGSPRRCGEQGSALMAAIAIGILAAFVIVAIMVNTMTSRDSSRESLGRGASEQLARDAGTALVAAYSGVTSGEFDGYMPSRAVLSAHAAKLDEGVVVDNSTLGALGAVDPAVRADRQLTVRQSLSDGRRGYWQVFSVQLPVWGTTRGGNVSVYVRSWTDGGSVETTTTPTIYRLAVRPTWFADYQVLIDGPIQFGAGATISGRVHSNGSSASFFNQYDPIVAAGERIRLGAAYTGVTCKDSARISTTRGSIRGSGKCATAPIANPDIQTNINLLRAGDLADRLREVCKLPQSERMGVSLMCINSPDPISVVLNQDTITANGTTLRARVDGSAPGQNQGAVVVTGGDVRVSGLVGPKSRALIVAASTGGATAYRGNGAPSVYIEQKGDFGSDPTSAASSFGIVAEGDVVTSLPASCPIVARGAFTAISGLLSINQDVRVPITVGNGPRCGGTASIFGSIAAHHAPAMVSNANNAGYATRNYDDLASLYHNPPPLYPTARDWEVIKFGPADLDCFEKSGTAYAVKAGGACG